MLIVRRCTLESGQIGQAVCVCVYVQDRGVLLDNTVLVSVAQQRESAICIHMSPYPLPIEPPSHPPYSTRLGHHKALSRSPCAMLLLPTSQLSILHPVVYIC